MFNFGHEEMDYLKSREPILSKFIEQIGFLERTTDDDLFVSLVGAIVSQQISGKAAKTVSSRLESRIGSITPINMAKFPDSDLQKCGLSWHKVTYIKDFTNKILKLELNLDDL